MVIRTEFGLIKTTQIEAEMRSSYLDYAMSVIVSRALPDVRDGLKPVHRRILYAMHDMGLRSNSSFKKKWKIIKNLKKRGQFYNIEGSTTRSWKGCFEILHDFF